MAKLRTSLLYQREDGSHCEKENVREFVIPEVRVRFPETVVVTIHDKRCLQSMLRENEPTCLNDMKVTHIILAEISDSMFRGGLSHN